MNTYDDWDKYKNKFDDLWADTYFKNADEADEYKRKFDGLWADFKEQLKR